MTPAATPSSGSASSCERLHGVDLARLFAAIGVVAIHCGDKSGAAAELGEFLRRFCVPFFFAAGAFFLVRDARRDTAPLRIGRRLERLLLPYACWSGIYLAARILKGILLDRAAGERLSAVSIWDILLLGKAAVHLYFLPVLAVGLLFGGWLAPVWRWLARRLFIVPWLIAFAFALGGFITWLPLPSSTHPALLNLLRLLTGVVLFLPSLLGSVLLLSALDALGGPAALQSRRWLTPVALLAFAGLNLPVVAAGGIPPVVHSWIVATLVLVAAVAWPGTSRHHPAMAFALTLPYGVYLSHHLVIEALRLMARLVHIPWPATLGLGGMLVLTLFATLGSVVLVLLLRRHRQTRRWLLGE